jgi:ABC-type phosphate transport system permease subunit
MNKIRAQHTIEYVMVIGLVILVLSAMVNMLSHLCSNRLGRIQDYVAEKEEP